MVINVRPGGACGPPRHDRFFASLSADHFDLIHNETRPVIHARFARCVPFQYEEQGKPTAVPSLASLLDNFVHARSERTVRRIVTERTEVSEIAQEIGHQRCLRFRPLRDHRRFHVFPRIELPLRENKLRVLQWPRITQSVGLGFRSRFHRKLDSRFRDHRRPSLPSSTIRIVRVTQGGRHHGHE